MYRASPPVAVGVLLGAAALGFVAGGVLGSLTSSGPDQPDEPDDVIAAGAGDTAATEPVTVTIVEASCEREAGLDSASNPVEYSAQLAADGDLDTAWQCRGSGEGETLTINLGEEALVTSVALIPGYTKVDPHDGTEWYPLNRRLTLVRWHFADGTAIEQELDPDPDLRNLQTMELPEPRTTDTLVLEVVSSVEGLSSAHPNVAVSELEVLAVRQ